MKQGLQCIPWDGEVREFGTLWTATGPKGETVRCYLTTHSDGWDLRLERDAELIRTHAFSDADLLFLTSQIWQAELAL
jgi:hypothetical protein